MLKKYSLYILFLFMVSNFYICSMNKQPVGFTPVGLVNVSGSCYMNALLQSLYNIDEMTELLLKKRGTNYYKPGSLAREYINFLHTYQAASGLTSGKITPITWCTKVRSLKDPAGKLIFPSTRFGDAEELLTILLNHLFDKDISNPLEQEHYGFPSNNILKTPLSRLFNIIIGDSRLINDFEHSIYSGKTLYYKGELVSNLELSLLKDPDNPNISALYDNINDCLEQYFTDGQSLYEDQNDKVAILNEKKAIITLPKILVIQYVRWFISYNKEKAEYKSEKIYKGVKFSINNFDLKQYLDPTAPKNQQTVYDLTAIIMHHGEGAHYTAYVKRGNIWYNCNDTSITTISKENLEKITNSIVPHLNPTPYILFYKQRPQADDIIYPKKIDNQDLRVELEKYYDKDITIKYLRNKKIRLQDLTNSINDRFRDLNSIIIDIASTLGLPHQPIEKLLGPGLQGAQEQEPFVEQNPRELLEKQILELSDLANTIASLSDRFSNI